MTMHLVGPWMTTTRTGKKKKSKMTSGKLQRYEEQLRQHNKEMKRMGCPNLVMTLDEYIKYCQGNYKPKTQGVVELPWHASGQETKRTKHIPSSTTEKSFAPATKKPTMEYTGTRKLVGIATMHKSNMIPVFADEDDVNGVKQATDLAQMRRN